MDRYGIVARFMFCLDEPDRHPGFRAPNDRTLAYAAAIATAASSRSSGSI